MLSKYDSVSSSSSYAMGHQLRATPIRDITEVRMEFHCVGHQSRKEDQLGGRVIWFVRGDEKCDTVL